jgi:hypothetical protein
MENWTPHITKCKIKKMVNLCMSHSKHLLREQDHTHCIKCSVIKTWMSNLLHTTRF